ncbi:uncharacterized protein CPUR_08302 [Claviceps purpurea 20.1]|uniref:Uncharacterized protein n=1 Tax=Claviceps purpurea (strain 20.1) TaxID=1111077 RepID=M1WCR7_CLAP2|nr:hypothetical protein E4U50_004502 [Claviceps purpurea]CCE34370.1 uncharacterized protein CPUR_08302 [Claviceps purpurea 20.1]
MQFKSLSLGLMGLLSMGLMASGQPVGNEAANVATSPPTTKWSPNEPAWFAVADSPEHATRDLASRAIWSSPHTRRAFVVGLGTELVSGAMWAFDMWVKEEYSLRLWRSQVSGSKNLQEANVAIPAVDTIQRDADGGWTGKGAFQMTGYVGTAELVVEFVAEIYASASECYIMQMIQEPVAKLAGAAIDVTSWTFAVPNN